MITPGHTQHGARYMGNSTNICGLDRDIIRDAELMISPIAGAPTPTQRLTILKCPSPALFSLPELCIKKSTPCFQVKMLKHLHCTWQVQNWTCELPPLQLVFPQIFFILGSETLFDWTRAAQFLTPPSSSFLHLQSISKTFHLHLPNSLDYNHSVHRSWWLGVQALKVGWLGLNIASTTY